MLSVPEVGKQILGNSPNSFYIFCGPEYGVKDKYLSQLKSFYNGLYSEYQEVENVFQLMRNISLIPLVPQLYIVRYDEGFIADLKESTLSSIRSLEIIGTIVLIYQDSKSLTKCNKFVGDYTVLFDTVAPQFVTTYLTKDFPQLGKSFIEFAVKSRPDYKGAYILCSLMSEVHESKLAEVGVDKLQSMLYCETTSVEEQIKLGIAARNFGYLLHVLEDYPEDYDNVIYTILNTLVDLDKLKARSYTESPLKPYMQHWTQSDIYNMYMFTYNALEQLRSISSDAYSQLIYLFGILQYQPIPSLSDMKG